MLLFVLSASCLSQFPLDIFPPPPSRPAQLQLQFGGPANSSTAAAVSIGDDYLIAWRDGRRKTPDSLGASSIVLQSVPTPLTVLGPALEVPGSVGLGTPALHLAATRQFSLLVAEVNRDGGTQLMGWKLGVGRWDGGIEPPFVIASDIVAGRTAAAGNDTEALVTWWLPTGDVMGQRFPVGAPQVLTSVGPISQLTVGGSDAGFVVAWREPSDTVQVLRAGVKTPLAMSASAVHAAGEFVVTQSTSNTLVHRWQPNLGSGMWTAPTVFPAASALVVARSPQTMFAASSDGGVLSARAWDVFDGGQTPTQLVAMGGAPLALAARRDFDKSLLVVNWLQGLHVAELSFQQSAGAATGTFSGSGLVSQNVRLAQRAPTVVWFDPLSAFVLMWDEEVTEGLMQLNAMVLTPRAGGLVQPIGMPIFDGVRPQLLRSPSGARFGLARSLSSSQQVLQFGVDGGMLTTGVALTAARNVRNAVLGEQVAVQWQSVPTLAVFTDQQPSPRVSATDPGPRCAAVMNGALWFVTTNSLHSTPDQPVTSLTVSTLTAPLPSACATASVNTPNLLYVGSRTNIGAQVSTVRASASGLSFVMSIAPIPGPVQVPPVLAAIDGGVVVAWAEPTGVKAAFAAEPATFISTNPLGGNDVTTISIAASPQGDVLVAWDSFDPTVQTRRVEYRFLLRPAPSGIDAGVLDGGVMVADAGSIDEDAGFVDAGSVDAGTTDADAGVVDAGFVDAGVVDAGLVDAGTTADAGAQSDGGAIDVTFVPVCGCTSVDASTLLGALALVLLARRRMHV